MNIQHSWKKQTAIQKFFIIFLLCSALAWILMPLTYHSVLHFDPAETLMWGSTFNLGSAKHPPMSGYMLYHFCRLFDFSYASIFLLSQLCVAVGFVYIYKLARCFYERDTSVIATLLITFYFLYNYETPKFNANIPHLLFIPMMCYYFYRGCFANKWHHWILLAISAAAACLSKYSAGVVGVTFCLFLLVNKDARKVLLTVKPYVAGVLFCALMAPHIALLVKTDFIVFNYVQHGKEIKYGYFGQLFALLAAVLLPLVCMSAGCLLAHIAGNKKMPRLKLGIVNRAAFQYSGCIIGGQAAFLLLMGIFGHRLETMWAFPLFLTAGILIMSFYPETPGMQMKRWFCILCSIVAVIMVLCPTIYYNFKSKYRHHLPPEEYQTAASDFYRKQTGKEIPFITGTIWETAMLQNTFKYTIKAAPCFDRILMAPHLENISRCGALVISSSPRESAMHIKQYWDIDLQWHQEEIKYAARFGKSKKFRFFLAIIPPNTPQKTVR